jgi:hypothetical protein
MSEFEDTGFTIVKGVFTEDEVSFLRKEALEYFNTGGGFPLNTGRAKPGWIREPLLLPVYELWKSKNIEKIIGNVVGEEVSFVGHSDLHMNLTVGWHKDRLNGEARKRYEKNSPWESVNGQTMKLYKTLLYLQPHDGGANGLTVKSGSHLYESMTRGEDVRIRTDVGDMVVFDQRITHKGGYTGGYQRYLISLGYGVKNTFFEQFEKGTKYRQDLQNKTNSFGY